MFYLSLDENIVVRSKEQIFTLTESAEKFIKNDKKHNLVENEFRKVFLHRKLGSIYQSSIPLN